MFKKCVVLFISTVMIAGLFGCDGLLFGTEPTVLTLVPTTQETQAPTTAIKFYYAVKYVSTGGVLDFDDTAVALITSEKELQHFLQENRYLPNDGIETFYDDPILSNQYDALSVACKKYDEDFFKVYSLILVITHGSSSVKHELTGVSHMEDGKLQVHMKLIAPEVCTSDVVGRLCIVELEKNDMPASVDDVDVYMDGKCIFRDGEIAAELKTPSTHIPVIYTQPPSLWIHGGSEIEEATLGTYVWSHRLSDDQWQAVCADSNHPLAFEDSLGVITVTASPGYIKLEFQDEPDSFSIRSWSDRYWGRYDAEETPVSMEDNLVQLNPGGYIYEITAVWNDDGSDYYGTVHYCFYVMCW